MNARQLPLEFASTRAQPDTNRKPVDIASMRGTGAIGQIHFVPTDAASSYEATMPFGVTGLRGWMLRMSERDIGISIRVVRVGLYARLKALEARVDTHMVCVTGVQGVRIMRLISLMSALPAGCYPVGIPFGAKGLCDWRLRAAARGNMLPLNVRQLRIYITLGALEARMGGCRALVTGVQGVRIMRLISLMTVVPADRCACPMPFGVKELWGWKLGMQGGDVPVIGWTLMRPPVPPRMPTSASGHVHARMRVRRLRLGMAACALGTLGCLTWLMLRDEGLSVRVSSPVHPATLARNASPSIPVRAQSTGMSPMPEPENVAALAHPESHLGMQFANTQNVDAHNAARLQTNQAVRPVVHPHAHTLVRIAPHDGRSTHRLARAPMYGPPVRDTGYAPARGKETLPDWVPDGPSALEDFQALTSGASGGHRETAPLDPTEWARHVTQRRVTEIPDVFSKGQ